MSNVQNNREHYTWSRRSQHFHTLRMYYSNGGWNKLWKSITIWGGDTLCLVFYWFLISRRRYKTSLPHHSLLLTLSSIAYMSHQGWVSAIGLEKVLRYKTSLLQCGTLYSEHCQSLLACLVSGEYLCGVVWRLLSRMDQDVGSCWGDAGVKKCQ